MTHYSDPIEEEGKAAFEQLRKMILRRERIATIRKRIAWTVAIAVALALIMYFS